MIKRVTRNAYNVCYYLLVPTYRNMHQTSRSNNYLFFIMNSPASMQLSESAKKKITSYRQISEATSFAALS